MKVGPFSPMSGERTHLRRLGRLLAGIGAAALVLGLAACDGAIPSPPPTPTPTPAPSRPFTTPRPAERLEARVAALYVLRLAPRGATSDYAGQQFGDEVYVGLQIDRGRGPVQLQINVQDDFFGPDHRSDPGVAEFYRCERGADARLTFDGCTVARNDDGSVLMAYTYAIRAGSPSRGRAVVADFLSTDGTRVVVTTGNVPDIENGGRPRRGVTLAQARRIVTDPVWDFDRAPSPADVAEAKRVVKPWRLLPS